MATGVGRVDGVSTSTSTPSPSTSPSALAPPGGAAVHTSNEMNFDDPTAECWSPQYFIDRGVSEKQAHAYRTLYLYYLKLYI